MRLTEGLAARAHARHPGGAKGAHLLICAPDHFGVDYVINPWMEGHVGKADMARARAQWENFRRALQRVATLEHIAAAPGLPDMVFTANAGLAIDHKVVVTRFAAPERRGEEALFRAFFDARGNHVADWPEHISFEGAGDALIDHARPLIWCGHGFRSSVDAPALLADIFGRDAIGLKLVDPRFYHLDTCFCPLSDGWLLYYPKAFDDASLDLIERHTDAQKRIVVTESDAVAFACNAVEAGRHVFMNHASDALKTQLYAAGFTPVVTPLDEFVKAGGGAKCLTLDLNAG